MPHNCPTWYLLNIDLSNLSNFGIHDKLQNQTLMIWPNPLHVPQVAVNGGIVT